MSDPRQPWEPDPAKMGKNWTAMFDPSARGASPQPPPAQPATQAYDDTELPGHDTAEYKPWTLQRGAGRPSLMIDLRRYDPKSGLWMGWQLAYAYLVATEYIGDRMVSLDFGTRQFIIEGNGLDELPRYLQQGTVTAVHEYSPSIWPVRSQGPVVMMIRRALPST